MPEEGKFAGLYDLFFGILLRKIQKNILDIVFRYKCFKIVDFGCGTGMQLSLLNKNGFDAIGIDISPLMIKAAKRKNINCILGDISNTPFPSSYFDCLNISFVLHPNNFENRNKILEEMKRIIKKDGLLILTDYCIPRKKFASFIIKIIEGFATKEHTSNYYDYMKRGAINGIIKKLNLKVEEMHEFYNGAVKTIVLMK